MSIGIHTSGLTLDVGQMEAEGRMRNKVVYVKCTDSDQFKRIAKIKRLEFSYIESKGNMLILDSHDKAIQILDDMKQGKND